MTTIPTNPPAGTAPHPAWCSPDHCEIHGSGLGDHRSSPVVVDPPEPFGEKVELWLSAFGFEPVETTTVYVNLRISKSARTGEVEELHSYGLPLAQAGTVLHVLGELVGQAENRPATYTRDDYPTDQPLPEGVEGHRPPSGRRNGNGGAR